jgi:predicted outer membrane protein
MIRLPSATLATLAGACMSGLLLAAGPASAQTTPAATAAPAEAVRLHAADQTFIADGTRAVATQRDAARIANARSTDRDVKAFAERVSNDNAKISDALRAASPRGVDVPKNDPDAAVLASINNLRGADFDKAYIEQVALAGEQKALSAFQAEIAGGRDEQLKDAAKKALPTIQEHYAMAQDLAKRKHLSAGAQ